MEKNEILKLPLYQWTMDNPNNSTKNGVENWFYGEYHFEVSNRHYYIDLRCYNGELVQWAFCRLFTYLNTDELFYDDILYNLPEYEGRRLSPKEFRNACELFVEEHAEKIEERIRKIEDGRRVLGDEEWKNLHVGLYTEPAKYCSWKEIDEFGRKYADKRFLLLTQYCPDCGSEIVKSYYCSAPWTWQQLCGREGWIFFCPNCRKQLQRNITAMN